MIPFKAPEPIEGELYANYFQRLIAEFERWANVRLPVDSTPPE